MIRNDTVADVVVRGTNGDVRLRCETDMANHDDLRAALLAARAAAPSSRSSLSTPSSSS